MIIAVDFDGTVVKHEYPQVGETIDGAVQTLKLLIQNGHQLILWTMRSGKELQDAVDWYKQNDIPLYGINNNPEQKTWTDSPKAFAQLYIDDLALGCPLVVESLNQKEEGGQFVIRAHVDWKQVIKYLQILGLIKQ